MIKSKCVARTLTILTLFYSAMGMAQWSPVENAMYTKWGEQVTPENTWTEYPRPQMKRNSWTNLNGIWKFGLTDTNSFAQTVKFDRDILVPFVMESPLSGIGERLKQGQTIWYQKEFEYQPNTQGKTLLNFEGVDYSCRVWINDIHVGTHTGGNLPFNFDVSHALKKGSNTIKVRVIDETDAADRYQLRGKQKVDNKSIWYTPSSGIWQTVWLEDVPNSYIQSIKMLANSEGQLEISAQLGGQAIVGYTLNIAVSLNNKVVHQTQASAAKLQTTIGDAQLWSPKSPTLYDVKVSLLNESGDTIDSIDSYVGFRTLDKIKDADGHWRFTLNGEPIFHWGPLDQGWWPDGLLTPPSDKAMLFDLQYLKSAGFNMVRKHKKVEPRRYYYHTDRLGLLVWQDHVSGGRGETDFSAVIEGEAEWPQWKRLESLSSNWKPRVHLPALFANRATDQVEADWPDWAHSQFMLELKTMIDTLYNHPSVVVWTTFNERWGQHRTLEVGEWVEQYDSSRYLNIASGGNFFEVGDIADQHDYPNPSFPFDVPIYHDYIKVVGEFGGHGWRVEGHQWDLEKEVMIYGSAPKSNQEFEQRYISTINMLAELKSKGIAAGVYTQTSDVEIEINGLITYDRKYLKFTPQVLKSIHQKAELVD